MGWGEALAKMRSSGQGNAMFGKILGAAFLAILIATASVLAQQQAPDTLAEIQMVGLPVYSSDGEKLGEVTDIGSMQGRQIVHADMGAFLGLGIREVLIPAGMFEQKIDRIEVPMSAAEVRETLAKQKKQTRQ
jgi:ribosomal 30S subunit maturation factor RimM